MAGHGGAILKGDAVFPESQVLEVRFSRSRPDRGIVHIETRVCNQRGERVLTLRRRFMVAKREP